MKGTGRAARVGLAWSQGILRLFSAGAIVFEAHRLFLQCYIREWEGVQVSGPNGCTGEEIVVNADILAARTLCNRPENFVPWIDVYKHHPVAAAIYYGIAAALILAIGFVIGAAYRRLGTRKPFGETPPAAGEHLR